MATKLSYLIALGLLVLCASFSSASYYKRHHSRNSFADHKLRNFLDNFADSESDEMADFAARNHEINTNVAKRVLPSCSSGVCCTSGSTCNACTFSDGNTYYCALAFGVSPYGITFIQNFAYGNGNGNYGYYYGLYSSAGCGGGASYLVYSTCPAPTPTTTAAPPSPAPASCSAYRGQVNTNHTWTITGTTTGGVWGTDIYTDDSNLATAAVHSGKVPAGATRTITVMILPGQSSYTGSTQNGVTSRPYGAFTGSCTILNAY